MKGESAVVLIVAAAAVKEGYIESFLIYIYINIV